MTDKQGPDVELGGAHSPEPSSVRKVHTLMLKRPSHRAALSGSDDYGYDESHYFELDEGENWLRLSQTESRHSILDDTQDFSQDSNNWFASILSLSSVGESVNVSNNCYLCLDVDGTIMAIKDMRPPSNTDDYPPLGLARVNNKKQWEQLPRRQLRILQPGDRICTAYEQGHPNGLVMEYQHRHLSTAKLLDSQRNALDLLTQPMEDEDDDEEETQTEPTPTANVQIVETQNYESDSTAEMTQSQVVLGGQPSLGLSTQPSDDDHGDSTTKSNNHHHNGPEPPSTPSGTVAMQKKQGCQGIPSPIAEADEGTSQGDITQEPVTTTTTPLPSNPSTRGQKDEGDDLVYSVTPKSNEEKLNAEAMDHDDTGKEDPSGQSTDAAMEDVNPNDVSTVPQHQHDDPAPTISLPDLKSTENKSSEKLDEVSEEQQNCNVSMEPENHEGPMHHSSQQQSPVEEDCIDPTKSSPEQDATRSNEAKDLLEDSTGTQDNVEALPSNATHEGQGESNATVPNDNDLVSPVEDHNMPAPSHDKPSSQDISMSMLRETGEETPLEGLNATNNDDVESDVTDVDTKDQAYQTNQSPKTTKLHQTANLANNDDDSEITEVDDMVPRKDPKESVSFLKFQPATKYDDDSEITEIDVGPVPQKVEEVMCLAPEVLQPSNTSNDDDENKISHGDKSTGTYDPKIVTDHGEEIEAILPSKGHEDERTCAIPTTEEIEGNIVHAAGDRNDSPDDGYDNAEVNKEMTSDSNEANSPKLSLVTRALDAERSDDKPVDEQDHERPSKPAETVHDDYVTDSTHLGSKSDCHETANARQIDNEKFKDGVTPPLTDASEKRSDDGVEDEQDENHENPSHSCQTDGSVPVDGVGENDKEDLSNDLDVNASNLPVPVVADQCSNKSDVGEEYKTTMLDEENEAKTARGGETSTVDQQGPLELDKPRKSKRKLRAEAYERAVEDMAHDKLQVQATHSKRRKQLGLDGADVHITKSSPQANDSTPQKVPGPESADETSIQQGKRRRMSKRMHTVVNDMSSPPAPTSIASSKSSATWSNRKGARGTPPGWNLDENPPIRVMATNVEIDSKGKQMVKKIGGVFIEKIEDAFKATHVIAACKDVKLKRTPKFMVAISRTSNIVHLDWLIESARKGEALGTQEFLLLDQTEAEKQYNFKLSETLARGNKLRNKGTLLLHGIDVFLCSGVAGSVRKGDKTPPENDFRLILEAAGAKVLTTLPTKCDSGQVKTVIITSKDAKERKKQLAKRDVMTAVKQGAIAKTAEEIFHAIMTQEFKI